jgi:putative glutamine amidotransferase
MSAITWSGPGPSAVWYRVLRCRATTGAPAMASLKTALGIGIADAGAGPSQPPDTGGAASVRSQITGPLHAGNNEGVQLVGTPPTRRKQRTSPVSDPFSDDRTRYIAISVGRIVAANGRVIDGTQRDYGDRIADVGGVPFLLTARSSSSRLLGRADGLVLTGGGDLEPGRYGAEQSPESGGIDTERDQVEMSLVSEAMALRLPVLAICRGIQLLNVARGGTLVQHLPDVTPEPHLVVERRQELVHAVRIAPDSELRRILGVDELGVNSLHHQAVDSVGGGLRPVAWAEDGTIEALEDTQHRIVAVQWHPEQLPDQVHQMRLFSWLLEQSGNRLAQPQATARQAVQ